jgi:hypothetical protein
VEYHLEYNHDYAKKLVFTESLPKARGVRKKCKAGCEFYISERTQRVEILTMLGSQKVRFVKKLMGILYIACEIVIYKLSLSFYKHLKKLNIKNSLCTKTSACRIFFDV